MEPQPISSIVSRQSAEKPGLMMAIRLTPFAASAFTVASVAGFSHSARPNCDWKVSISLSEERLSASPSRRAVLAQWQ